MSRLVALLLLLLRSLGFSSSPISYGASLAPLSLPRGGRVSFSFFPLSDMGKDIGRERGEKGSEAMRQKKWRGKRGTDGRTAVTVSAARLLQQLLLRRRAVAKEFAGRNSPNSGWMYDLE